MRFLKPLFAAAVLSAAMVAAPAAIAQPAQSATVIVLEYERIIATSDVGRDMSAKINAIGTQMQGELQPEATALETEQRSLQQATQGMTGDQVRANTQLAQRIEALSQRAEQFRTRQLSMARDMDYTRQFTLNHFNELITPFVREVMEARSAGVVLDAGAVQLALPAFNATEEVISRLNQRLRTIDVARQTAPPPPPQQAGAAPSR